ncbi:MAG: DUF4115 domain-containing protein [Rhodobacteraceae bacterium]|nr:DUF4115 domain-containing protein [Paracoccaceae bacterium]
MEESLEGREPRGFDAFEVTLGDEMRGERATLGKSLLDVQRDLRIKATYLAAIENCDHSVFQTPGFIAGYVRSYARYLGMNAEDCFYRFCEESGFDGVHADLKTNMSLAKKSATLLQTPIRPANADPISSPRVPLAPASAGFLSRLSPSGLGSIVVLSCLIAGLGYGGWTVVQEVQRVQFAPVNQTPGVTSDIAELGTVDAQSDPGIVTLSEISAPEKTAALNQLYRPQELEVPQLIARDGPIVSINPDSLGNFTSTEQVIVDRVITAAPKVIEEGPPPVDVVAVKPAWVRVYFEDGTVLFEKILDAGERYRLPQGVEEPLLRAGNAGAVYVMIADKTFGPVGSRGGVARDVSLAEPDVTDQMAQVFDVFDSPLSAPINIDDLKRNADSGAEVPEE